MKPVVTKDFPSRHPFEMAIQDFPNSILKTQNKLYRFALRILGSVQEAEDVVQEVLMKVWEKRLDLGNIHNKEAWCMRMVKNKSLDKLKAKPNQPHEAVESLYYLDSNQSPERETENRDMLDHVGRIIANLPEKQRMCIQLREIEGHSYEEISEILEISMNQVKTNIFRARQKIRTAMMRLEEDEKKKKPIKEACN